MTAATGRKQQCGDEREADFHSVFSLRWNLSLRWEEPNAT
jgi:hypothetical protein